MPVIKLKRGRAARWAGINPVLEDGEPGVETDTKKLKIGDGVTPWLDLPYYGSQGGTADEDLLQHVQAEAPHPAYDEGVSPFLLYENAKV